MCPSEAVLLLAHLPAVAAVLVPLGPLDGALGLLLWGPRKGGMILEAGQKLGVVVSSKCASPRAPHSPAIKRLPVVAGPTPPPRSPGHTHGW